MFVPDPLEAASDEDHEHRPLTQVEVVPDLDRPLEDSPVEPVDLLVSLLARQAPAAGDLRIVAALLHLIRCV